MMPERTDESWCSAPLRVPLPNGEVHVWRVRLDQAAARTACPESWLSPEELRRADGFRFPRDRQRFIVRRGAARLILARYLGGEPGRIHFCYSEHGKPSLAGGGELAFNWSDSDELALYALARGRLVGVDLERRRPDREHGAIAERFFTPNETARLRALPEGEQLHAFFSLWTCKEAWLKATGVGLSFPLDQVELLADVAGSPVRLRVRGRLTSTAEWSVRALDPAPGYAAAVVAEGDDWQVRSWELTFP